MAKWTDNINGEPYTSRGVRTVRRRAFGNTTIAIWQGAGCLAYVVANRLNHNGKNTADHFKNYARIGTFSRRMEHKLGLVQAPDMRINQRRTEEISVTDHAHLKLRQTIDKLLDSVKSIDELKQELVSAGYKSYIGRGIAFFNMQKKIKIKGSDLGRDYSLSSLEKRLAKNLEIDFKKELKPDLKKQKKPGLGL